MSHTIVSIGKKILQFSILLQIYIRSIFSKRDSSTLRTCVIHAIIIREKCYNSRLQLLQIYIRIVIYSLLTTNSSALIGYESHNYSAFVRIEWNIIWFSMLLQICIHIYYKIYISREKYENND